MLVDIDWVRSVKKRLVEINQCDIEDIRWLAGGEEVVFSADDVKEWVFTGLDNIDIIHCREYKPKNE